MGRLRTFVRRAALRAFLAVTVLEFWGCARPHADYAFSGTLQSARAAVGSTIGGRVTALLVSDGTIVRAGDVLVRFDDLQQRAALHSALARVAQARATLVDLAAGARNPDLARARALASQQRATYEIARRAEPDQLAVLEFQVRQAEAQAADAAAASEQARVDAWRERTLYATGDVSSQARDAASARDERAAAQVANASAALRAARVQLAKARDVTLPGETAAASASYRAAREAYRSLAVGARPGQIAQARAAVEAALGDAATARARMNETVVRAPGAGMVTDMDLHAGDLVAAGAAVATIEERADPYVRIYVPQSAMGRLRVGTNVGVKSDALADAAFAGSVEQIDSQAQFTPQNVQTSGDRATLSFGVKVRVRDPQRRLHAGTTLEVALP